MSSLHRWVEQHLDEELSAPLTPYIQAITQVREQDLETTKDRVRIRRGVAPEPNRPEEEGAVPIRDDIAAQGLELVELHIGARFIGACCASRRRT